MLSLSGNVPGRLYATSLSGEIYLATDGGTTFNPWKAFPGFNDLVLNRLWCSPGEHLMVTVGSYVMTGGYRQGHIVSSLDGGVTWTHNDIKSSAPGETYLGAVWAPENSEVVLAAGAGMYRSTNRGRDWSEILPSPSTDTLTALWGTPDGKVIYCTTDRANILRSMDLGSTWENVFEGEQSYTSALWGTSENDVYAGGERIYHYDGKSWTKMFIDMGPPGAESTRDTFFCADISGTPDGKQVYAACYGGRVYIHEPRQVPAP